MESVLGGGAIGAVVAAVLHFLLNRRKAKAEPVQMAAIAVAQVAAAVDEVIRPLRIEVMRLRKRVTQLSEVLQANGIAVPEFEEAS